jgi:hypothetical protein
MTDNFQENIDGVGPARDEKLEENGYTEYTDLAEAEAGDLSDSISHLTEDTALEIIVQAQNMVELNEASVEENPTIELNQSIDNGSNESSDITEGNTNNSDSDSDSDNETASENKTPDTNVHRITLTLDTKYEYDALYDTLITYRQKLIRTNRNGVSRAAEYLTTLRKATVGDAITLKLDERELNGLHNMVKQNRMEYQGKNYGNQLEGIRSVEDKINTQRRDLLFE